MADRERVSAEIDGLEAVVHGKLRAHRVVYARAEEVWLGSKKLAHARARSRPARGRDEAAVGQQRRSCEIRGRGRRRSWTVRRGRSVKSRCHSFAWSRSHES